MRQSSSSLSRDGNGEGPRHIHPRLPHDQSADAVALGRGVAGLQGHGASA